MIITYRVVLWAFQSIVIIQKIILATRTMFIFMASRSSMNLTSTVRMRKTKIIRLLQQSFAMKPSVNKGKGSLFHMKLQRMIAAIIS